jgi:hypothetical protein
MKLSRIAIIIPYYGKFPWYFDLFLHSVSFNPSIDIIIVSDLPKPVYCPNNVRFIKMTQEEIRKLASLKLNFKVEVDMPYKLCDFRPAYGYIFSDYIKEYDFWGFGDIDVIYGNVRDFISEDLLASYDFISVRDDYVTGFFSLVRNTVLMNTLFMKSKDHIKVFSSPGYCRFDECAMHIYHLLGNRVSIYDIQWDIESMTYIVKKYHDEKLIRACFYFLCMEATPGNMIWNNGVLIYDNKSELLLYHLIDLKKRNRGQNIAYESIPDCYYIDCNRIRL